MMIKRTIFLSIFFLIIGFFSPNPAKASFFEKLFMPGKLISGHVKYENKCKLCHETFKQSLSHLCLDCHKKISKDIKELKGFHGKYEDAKKAECVSCHTEHKGRDYNIVQLDKDMFNHKYTDFFLKYSHVSLPCSACHSSKKKYRDTKSECIDCHKKDDFHRGKLGKKCSDCHDEIKWSKVKYDHDKTKFPLKGKHKKTKCISCHPDSRYKKTPKNCYECHKLNDIHGGSYTKKCSKCHNSNSWKKSIFDHKKIKSIGKIKLTDCYTCHKDNDFHKKRYGKECKNCHKISKWKPGIFDHDKTKFPLKEKHKKVNCDACHPGDIYKDKLKENCYFCHKNNDEHNGRYGEKCEDCHTSKRWNSTTFDHDKTDFLLEEKHKKVSCGLCHKGELYKKKLGVACRTCHLYDDVHKKRYGKVCKPCHTPKEWKKAIFDHEKTIIRSENKESKEKIIKSESKVLDTLINCEKCYKERLEKDCYGCHKINDVHKEKEGKVCERCHNTENWSKEVFFDHDLTSFPLIGLHSAVSCEGCHLEKTYKGVKKECIECHEQDDEHKKRLGINCIICHNPNGWKFWIYDHNTQSKFKIDGAHEELECLLCHKEPVKDKFKLSKTCYSCHEKDSVHRGRFWKNCSECHITKSFEEIKIH